MLHVLLIILDQFLLANGGHRHLYNSTGPLHRDQHPQHGGGGLLGAQVPRHQGTQPAEEEPISGANRTLEPTEIFIIYTFLSLNSCCKIDHIKLQCGPKVQRG